LEINYWFNIGQERKKVETIFDPLHQLSMFMKVQTYLKCSKVSKIIIKIAPDWNGLRPFRFAFLEVFFLVYLISKSTFL
jgi:hypothetical protein